MTYNCKIAQYEYDEFISKCVCAADPTISTLQEVILIYLKELAYYLINLKELGAENEVIKEHIIEAISGIVAHVDYDRAQFEKIAMALAQDLSQARTIYAGLCKNYNEEARFLKPYFKHTKYFDINEIVKKAEVHYVNRNMDYDSEKKNLFDIIILLIKRIGVKIIQVKSYKKNYEESYLAILNLFCILNFNEKTLQEIKSTIENSNLEYYKLEQSLYRAQEEAYGKRESVYISFAPRNGKAILVSGIDMVQLEEVLKATQNRGVDVYTHGHQMLMAHTFAKFRKYKHLAGHYGKVSGNCLFDFASFPGAILMTRYLFQKVQYLYRGRLFTTDSFAPNGIIKIQNNNYEPLIQAALQSKGFTKKQQDVILRVGFRQKILEEKVEDVIGKMLKGEIKHLYIIGLLNQENENKDYFEKFINLVPKDCYVLSLAYEKNEENILHVDSFYDYLLIYSILEKISEKKPLDQLKISIFITKCDQYTITNLMNFINMGVKNIYLCKCVPTLINPAMAQTLIKIFGVKEFSTPEYDIEQTLSQ